MNFFLYQPEAFFTINIILGQMMGPVPAVLFFGGIFIVIVLLAFFFKRRFNWSVKNIIIVAVLIAWLPLLFQFTYSSITDLKNIYNFVDAPEESQILWRYCSLDKNYNSNGTACDLYPFAKAVKSLVPLGSSIRLFAPNIEVYLRYYLYDSYRIDTSGLADYFIFYKTPRTYLYEAGKLYFLQNNKKEYLGDFTIVKLYGPYSGIFKRTIK